MRPPPPARAAIDEALIDQHVLERHHDALAVMGEIVADLARPCDCGCQVNIRRELRLALRQCRRTLDLVGREPTPPATDEMIERLMP